MAEIMGKIFSPRSTSKSSLAGLDADDSSSSLSSSQCPCRLLFDGEEVGDGAIDVLPGQRITLWIDCSGSIPTDISWSLTGLTFRNYDASTDSAVLTPVVDADLHESTVFFYWADTGDDREITVNFKCNGADCSKTAKFNVAKPTIVMAEAVIGSIQLVDVGPAKVVRLLDAPGHTNGVLVRAAVTLPTGFSGGEWCYVQTTELSLIRKMTSSGLCQAVEHNGEIVCDGSYPYLGPWATLVLGIFIDTPDNDLNPFASEYHRDQWYDLYIFFKPSGAFSQYVPLAVIHWDWGFCTSRDDTGSWVLHNDNANMDDLVPTSIHPEWSAAASSTWQTAPVTCPPPCQ